MINIYIYIYIYDYGGLLHLLAAGAAADRPDLLAQGLGHTFTHYYHYSK